ncbi:MAG TPA: class I SAM-dependent methyltransferase [Phototrophicaceae bacterium]|nr:class I SAM-dependent methyltransferase [Phototrophicaceae bacterium]
MFSAIDPNAIRQMYTTDEAWRIRQETHDRYSIPQVNFAAWALDCLTWRGDEKVLDLGCGPGRWYEALRPKAPAMTYYGLDLHTGMLTNHPAVGALTVGDAQQLPFADDTFDMVMANHMLYHVPDVENAIREIRRILKPDGILMATTNSVHNMPELQVLLHRAVTLLVPPGTAQFQTPLPPQRPVYTGNRHPLPGATFLCHRPL